MAKKKSTNEIASPIPYEPPTRICVTKAQASNARVGKKVSITVEGEVQGVRKDYGDGSKYEIELKDSKVIEISGNRADDELEDLKDK